MPQYNELWNAFPRLTSKFQMKVSRLAALACVLVLATSVGILAWVDSTRTFCPGWIIGKHEDTIWIPVWFLTLPITLFWCWRALFMTERKILAETKTKYGKGPPYGAEEPFANMTAEDFRKSDFDSGICAVAVALVLFSAAPLLLIVCRCSPLAQLWQ